MKKIIISVSIVVFFMLSANDVFACSCLLDNSQPVKKQVKTAYQKAAAVFYGEVTEVTRQSKGLIVKIKVEQSWKRQTESEAIVYTLADSAMCGYPFERGKKYLVYADEENGKLGVILCSRTNPSNQDARYLNKIKKPVLFTVDQKEKINK